MTSPVVGLLTEIVARITKAKTDNKLTAKDIFIGDIEQWRKPNDYPIVVVAPESYESVAEYMPWGLSDNVSFFVAYIHGKLSDNNNRLYKSVTVESVTTETGILYEVDNILNYVEKKTSDGAVDLSINGHIHSLIGYVVNFDYSQEGLIKAIIKYTVKTNTYIRGSR